MGSPPYAPDLPGPDARRHIFYCPSNPDREVDVNWFGAPTQLFSRTGYSFLVQRDLPQAGVQGGGFRPLTWPNNVSLLVSTMHETNPVTHDPNPASRELIMDIVVGNTMSYDLRNPASSATFTPATNHMKGSTPAGGNICFLDGHVEWRAFSEMNVPAGTTTVISRCSDQQAGVYFYW